MARAAKVPAIYVVKTGSGRLVFGEFFNTKAAADSYILNYGRKGWRPVKMLLVEAIERGELIVKEAE